MSTSGSQAKKDFFISYTGTDREWAGWIAWQLEAAGYSVVFQGWDFLPSSNFVLKMDQATKNTERTLVVLSPDALLSHYVQSEWATAFQRDPTGEKGLLLPVRVRACEPTGLLAQVVYSDLVGLGEAEARQRLLEAVQAKRVKPTLPPNFPGRPQPYFPSLAAAPPSPDVISGKVLFQADFSNSQRIYDEWDGDILSGGIGWQIAGGMLTSSGNSTDEVVWVRNPLPTANYAVEARMQVPILPDGRSFSSPYIGTFVRGEPPLGGYLIKISGLFALDTAYFSTFYGPTGPRDRKLASYPLDKQWHTYCVQVANNVITFIIDGLQVFRYTDSDKLFTSPGQAGLGAGLQKVNVRSFTITAL
jgi:TIR domain